MQHSGSAVRASVLSLREHTMVEAARDNGTADDHEVVERNPDLCAAPNGGTSFRVDGGDLVRGGEYPIGDPIVSPWRTPATISARSCSIDWRAPRP